MSLCHFVSLSISFSFHSCVNKLDWLERQFKCYIQYFTKPHEFPLSCFLSLSLSLSLITFFFFSGLDTVSILLSASSICFGRLPLPLPFQLGEKDRKSDAKMTNLYSVQSVHIQNTKKRMHTHAYRPSPTHYCRCYVNTHTLFHRHTLLTVNNSGKVSVTVLTLFGARAFSRYKLW